MIHLLNDATVQKLTATTALLPIPHEESPSPQAFKEISDHACILFPTDGPERSKFYNAWVMEQVMPYLQRTEEWAYLAQAATKGEVIGLSFRLKEFLGIEVTFADDRHCDRFVQMFSVTEQALAA